MRYEYKSNSGNVEYKSDELDEDIICRMLNNPNYFCTEVKVIDRRDDYLYTYSMERKLIKKRKLIL